jgi:hypothetical protein
MVIEADLANRPGGWRPVDLIAHGLHDFIDAAGEPTRDVGMDTHPETQFGPVALQSGRALLFQRIATFENTKQLRQPGSTCPVDHVVRIGSKRVVG